jgi:hypothetical protein
MTQLEFSVTLPVPVLCFGQPRGVAPTTYKTAHTIYKSSFEIRVLSFERTSPIKGGEGKEKENGKRKMKSKE